MATIPLLFFVGASCLLGLMSWELTASSKNAAGANLAERQCMLNERHVRQVLLVGIGSRADYAATRTLLMESLDVLTTGAEHDFGQIPKATDSDLLAAINTQREKLKEHFKIADEYLQAVQQKDPRSAEYQAKLVSRTAVTESSAQAVVSQLASQTIESNRAGLTRAIGLSLLITLLSGAWSVMCSRVVASQVGCSVRQVKYLSNRELKDVSRRLRGNAESTTSQAMAASGVAEQVSANASVLTQAVEQFEQSIKEIAGNASCAASVAQNAVDATEETNTTIRRLGDSSAEISNVIKVINSIAEQTNLLALNATIEAARAGEAGKGFAVVANEVKELAKETSKATEDIVSRIETIQNDTQEAVNAIGQVSGIISQISESQNAIAGAVEQQTAMTSEISRNISEVAVGSDEIATSISLVAEAAKSTTTGSDEAFAAAAGIEKMVNELMVIVGQAKQETTNASTTKHSLGA